MLRIQFIINAMKMTVVVAGAVVILSCNMPTNGDSGKQNGSEGTITSPVSIGSAAGGVATHDGQVADSASSYYVVGVTDLHSYMISLAGNTGEVDIDVFSDADFTVKIAGESTTTEDIARGVAFYI